MLVQNKQSLNGQVAVIKLTTGEEVIARVGTYEFGDITVKNPLSMVMVPDEGGEQGMVAFAPWMLALPDDDFVEIKSQHIICAIKARKDAADQYSQALGESQELITPSVKSAIMDAPVARKGGRGR